MNSKQDNKWKKKTVRFYVDNCMSSNVDKKFNDDFQVWLNKMYGDHGEVKAVQGNKHDYLGMTLVFGNREVKVDMFDYFKNMLEEFPVKFNPNDKKITSPGGIKLFKEDLSQKLNEGEREIFHQTVSKGLFVSKRGRPDIQTVNTVLINRVKAPGRKDWLKLVRMMKLISGTINEILTLSVGKGINSLEWYVNATFRFHPDYKGHTGAVLKFKGGKGSPIQQSSKQKLNTGSSTMCKLVGVNNILPKILWTPLFLEE